MENFGLLDNDQQAVLSGHHAALGMVDVHKIDPTALLVLWQPGLAGELSLKRFETTSAKLQVLMDKLLHDYPFDQPVILYEAAIHPKDEVAMVD